MSSETSSEPHGTDGGAAEAAPTPDDHVMGLLSEHVPLSLIVDLSSPEGPDSAEILTEEGEPEDDWWGVSGDGSVAQDDDTAPTA